MRTGHWLAVASMILVLACTPARQTDLVPSTNSPVPSPAALHTVEQPDEGVTRPVSQLPRQAATPTDEKASPSPLTVSKIPPLSATPRPSATSTPWFSPTLSATSTSPPSRTPLVTPTPPPSPTPSVTPTPTSPPDLAALPGHTWNMQLVGHNPLEYTGWWASMGLHDICAYVGSYTQPAVAVVDISNPEDPQLVGSVALEEGTQPVEVRAVPEYDLLVVADLRQHKLFTFDIGDCARPELRGFIQLPGSPHEFYLWYDGSQVLAYVALFDDAPVALVVDLTDPARPQEVARWSTAEEGARGLLHSLSVSSDGSRAYLALWNGGFLVAEVNLPQISLARDPQDRFAAASFPSTHSALPMDEPRYVLLASETFRCPCSGLALADISDPAHPQIVSEFKLPENRCTGLPSGASVFSPYNFTTVGRWVLVSWYAAGVQVIDWSDPLVPHRIAQFVPLTEGATPPSLLGDYPVQMFSHPILREGLIYVIDSVSGLYILRYTGPRMDKVNAVLRAEGNLSVRQ